MKITTLKSLTTAVLMIAGASFAAADVSHLHNLMQQRTALQLSSRDSSGRDSDYKKGRSIFDKFSEAAADEVLEITLTTDVQTLAKVDGKPEYQPAFIAGHTAGGKKFEYQLKVKPRGKYRRKVCDFPPLKLNFSKKDLAQENLTPDFDKLKLVTHCTDNRAMAKDNVLREYLTYKMYNLLTPNSFRVQLVRITYVDLHNGNRPFTRYGFLIEDTDEMATRINGTECDCHGLSARTTARAPRQLMTMFQYMIGNEDWNIAGLRNMKAVQLLTGGEADNILVPYDFDFAGTVNAEYAVPSSDLQHRSVLQRHFAEPFVAESDFAETAAHFFARKDDLFALVKDFKELRYINRIEMQEYLREFFLILEDEEKSRAAFFAE